MTASVLSVSPFHEENMLEELGSVISAGLTERNRALERNLLLILNSVSEPPRVILPPGVW